MNFIQMLIESFATTVVNWVVGNKAPLVVDFVAGAAVALMAAVT